MDPRVIGIIGVGNISPAYLKNLRAFPGLEVRAVADIDLERASARAAEFEIPKACTPGQLLADDSIGLVLNLTVPLVHAEVNRLALEAGKHVYCEKPFAVDREDGKATLATAAKRGLKVGCAPDTVLGAGIQTARRAIDEGMIGRPVAAQAFMLCRGHESWHPAPEFYYQKGGGPMFDMGPYYLHALATLLGPAKRVAGSATASFAERLITSEPKKGTVIPVETPTHITGAVEYEAGAVATITMSFDVHGFPFPNIVIFGEEGTMSVPDPNTFGGDVMVRRAGAKDFEKVEVKHGYPENSRGLGVLDMVDAIQTGREPRAGGKLADHVLEVMHAFLSSSAEGKLIEIESRPPKPEAMPAGLSYGQI